MFRILICGDRNWTDAEFILDTLRQVIKAKGLKPKDVLVIDGGARGTDEFGNWAAIRLNCRIKRVFAEWFKFGRAAGPIRNRKMVALKPQLVLAFHNSLATSKGTKDMVSVAMKAGISVRVCSNLSAEDK